MRPKGEAPIQVESSTPKKQPGARLNKKSRTPHIRFGPGLLALAPGGRLHAPVIGPQVKVQHGVTEEGVPVLPSYLHTLKELPDRPPEPELGGGGNVNVLSEDWVAGGHLLLFCRLRLWGLGGPGERRTARRESHEDEDGGRPDGRPQGLYK